MQAGYRLVSYADNQGTPVAGILIAGRVLPATRILGDKFSSVLEILRDPAFRRELALIPGYDPSFCGVVQSLEEAFPTMRDG